MLDSFKLFFEARQEYIDKLEDAINKVSDRPFNDLFQGKGERFLVKVFNPKFQKAAAALGMPVQDFDITNRKFQTNHINTAIKQKMKQLQDEYNSIDFENIKKKLIDNFIAYRIDVYAENPIYQTAYSIAAYKPIFASTKENEWSLYTSDHSFIAAFEANKYLKDNYHIHEILTEQQIAKLLKDVIHLRVRFLRGGFNDQFNKICEGVNNSIIKILKDKKETFKAPLNNLMTLKQAIDQNNIYYYLLFSRHPIDVLRMSDHKGISSCHRLGGGKYSSDEGNYADCALADAKNDGGIVYLIKGSDGKRVFNKLNDREIFHDADRNQGDIQPIGRIRLRRFIDLTTGNDFAVPTTLQSEQRYGYITPEIYQNILDYTRNHQPIFKNPPDYTYARNNIVLVGGDYSDESLSYLLNNFFGKEDYDKIQHKTNNVISWHDEVTNILNQYQHMLQPLYEVHAQPVVNHNGNPYIFVRISSKVLVPYQKTWNAETFSEHMDRCLDSFNSQKRIFKYWFKDTTRGSMGRENQECTWDKGMLDININFTMSDPDDMYLIIGNLLNFKKNFKKGQEKIFKEFNSWMLALQEE